MAKHFTYVSKYGTTYEDCFFKVGRYENNNLAVQLISDSEGPVMTITTNTGARVRDKFIVVKNYSENEGIDNWLYELGMIEEDEFFAIESGHVDIPVYRLTEYGKEVLGIE